MSNFSEVFKFLQKNDSGTFTISDGQKEYSCSFNIQDKNENNSSLLIKVFPSHNTLENHIYFLRNNKKCFLTIIKCVKSNSPFRENTKIVVSLRCDYIELVENNLSVTTTDCKLNGIGVNNE